MKTILRTTLSALSTAFVFAAVQCAAQGMTDEDMNRLFDSVEPYVVQIKVTGTLDGKGREAELGTGVIFRAPYSARVMTAGHVVGLDQAFDADPSYDGRRKRDVWLRRRSEFGSARLDPVHLANVKEDIDVAQVFIEGDSAKAPWLSSADLKPHETVLVVSWPDGNDRPRPRQVRVLPRVAQDGSLVRLSEGFPKSSSGSPVINKIGDIVAILIRSSNLGGVETSLAIPVSEFTGWLSANVVRPGNIRLEAVQPPPSQSAPPVAALVEVRPKVIKEQILGPQAPSDVMPINTVIKRSGNKPSGPGASFSQPYRLCSDPLPPGKKIVSKEFFLEGDRSCGSWAECRAVTDTPDLVCFEFRLQGHNEAFIQSAGVKFSEGVLRVSYK